MTSSSLGLTTVLGTACDVSGIFANIVTGVEELRQEMTEGINRVEERAQQGNARIRDELADAKSQAKSHQAELILNTDQCLAESLALATKESEERKIAE